MNTKFDNGKHNLFRGRGSLVRAWCLVWLALVPAIAGAQNWSQHEIDDVVDGVSGIWSDTGSIDSWLENISDDVQEIVNNMGSPEMYYWTNNVDWRTKFLPGIRQDLYDWLYPFSLQTGNGDGQTGLARRDAWQFLWFNQSDREMESQQAYDMTDSHVEFENLVFGQNVDMSLWYENDNNPDNLFDKAFDWHSSISYYDNYGVLFWNVWQAEAWRRQLYALGAATNSWLSFTNSPVLASMADLGTEEQLGYTTSNAVESFESVISTNDGESVISKLGASVVLKTLSPTIYGTNELESTEEELEPSWDLLTNSNSRLYSSISLAPPNDVGGLNFQANFDTRPGDPMRRVEVDLNGTPTESALVRVKNSIHLLLSFAFVIFQVVESFRTLLYIMRLDTGQGRSASV